MRLHDYVCEKCGKDFLDELSVPRCCEANASITFKNWRSFNMVRDIIADALTDAKGYRQNFTALEDPVCRHSLGLETGGGINNFSPDQTREYQEKLQRDGDSPKLRKEILATRKENDNAHAH
jgi:hypothetical protein